MENNNKDPGEEIDRIYDQEKDRRAEESMKEVKSVTVNQEILIKKLLKSRKFKDVEYRELRNVLDNKVQTSYDASVLINYLLGVLSFRRNFYNGKHKAYKKCFYCNSRDQVKRYLNVASNKKAWVCEFCAINLDPEKVVPVKVNETFKVPGKDHVAVNYSELTSAQEDLICEHKEQ